MSETDIKTLRLGCESVSVKEGIIIEATVVENR